MPLGGHAIHTPRPSRHRPVEHADATPSEQCTCDGRGTCRSCSQRRVRAWRLVQAYGIGYAEAAKSMGLSVAGVRLMIAQERDRRELKAFKRDWVETAAVRAFVERELDRDPTVTRSALAHWLDMNQIDFDRQLGYTPKRDGRLQQRIGIPAASRVAIALGRAPRELDGC